MKNELHQDVIHMPHYILQLAQHCVGKIYNPAFKLASINLFKSPSNTA